MKRIIRQTVLSTLAFLISTALLVSAQALPVSAADLAGPETKVSAEDNWTGHISYVLGYKRVGSEWSPANDHVEFGILDLDFRRMSWPVSLAAQLLLSYTGGVPDGLAGNNSGSYEFNFGLRKVWDTDGRISPFLGGGPSVIGASNSEFTKFSNHDNANVQDNNSTALGFWLNAGSYVHVTESFDVGLMAQFSWGEIRLGGKNLNAGGLHLLSMLGYHW